MSSKQNKKGSLAIAGVLVAADKTLAYNGHKEDEVSHTDNQGSSSSTSNSSSHTQTIISYLSVSISSY